MTEDKEPKRYTVRTTRAPTVPQHYRAYSHHYSRGRRRIQFLGKNGEVIAEVEDVLSWQFS